mgnify:CR=1 FL=1
MANAPHPESYRDSLRAFLREDWGTQDWSTAAVPDRPMAGRVVAKADLTLAGLPVALEVLKLVDPAVEAPFSPRTGIAWPKAPRCSASPAGPMPCSWGSG